LQIELDTSKNIQNAEIYKITFEVEGKKFLYIGLDTKCNPNYFGSSLIIYHYKRIFGKEIFKKEIINRYDDIGYKSLCEIEQDLIKKSKKNAKKLKYISVNYTGENKANVTSWQWMDI